MNAVGYFIGNFLSAMSRQTVHHDRVPVSLGYQG
jgi:hypothetical protein